MGSFWKGLGSALGSAAFGNVAGLVGGIGSTLLGNKQGSDNVDKTNQTNKEIAQMNNDFNERMFERQMEYNTEMWNKQNEYNTPLQQMQRLKAAGINPYLALGLISGGTATGANGVSPPSAQGATMQAFQPDYSGIGSAMQSYVVNKQNEEINDSIIAKNKAEEDLTRNEADYYGIKVMAEINERMSSARGKNAQAFWQEAANKYADQIFSSDVYNKQLQNQQMEGNIRRNLVGEAMDLVHLIHLPQKYQLEFSSMMATTALAVAQKELTKNQATHEILKWLKTNEETEKIKLDNKLFNATFDAMVDKAKIDATPTNLVQAGWYTGTEAYKTWYDRLAETEWSKIHLKDGKKPW